MNAQSKHYLDVVVVGAEVVDKIGGLLLRRKAPLQETGVVKNGNRQLLFFLNHRMRSLVQVGGQGSWRRRFLVRWFCDASLLEPLPQRIVHLLLLFQTIAESSIVGLRGNGLHAILEDEV